MHVARMIIMLVVAIGPLVASYAMPEIADAQINRRFRCDSSTGLRCDEPTVSELIQTVINWMLGIAFGIAVLFLIIGGFWYITSAGNEETAGKGKSTVINALIGIVIIIMSYVIVNVVANLVSSRGDTGI